MSQKAKWEAWDIIASVVKELQDTGSVNGYAKKPYDVAIAATVKLEAAGIKLVWDKGMKPK